MASPVIVKFQVDGVAQVQAAFRTVEQAVVAAEAAKTRITQKGAEERLWAVRRRLAEEERLEKAWAKKMESIANDTAKGIQKIHESTKTNEARVQEQALREFKKTEAQKTTAVEQESRKRSDSEKRSVEEISRMRKNQAERDAEFARRHMAQALGGAVASGFSRGVGTVASIGRSTVNMALGMGGGFDLANSVNQTIALRHTLAELANSGYIPGDPRNGVRIGAGALEKDVRNVSKTWGHDEATVAKGLHQFTKVSGDLATGRELLPQLAEFARATGSDIEDSMGASGAISAALARNGVKDNGTKTMQIMRSLAGQGKIGAVEISDLDTQIPKMIAAAMRFEGNLWDEVGPDGKIKFGNISKMGAIAQEARGPGGAWSAASAATALSSMSTTFAKGPRLEKFKALGIKTQGKNGATRDIQDIMLDSMKVAFDGKHGDPQKILWDLFNSAFSERAIGGFRQAYARGGKAEYDKEWNRYLNDRSVMTPEEQKAAADKAMEEDPGARTQKTIAKFNEAVAEKLIPKLMEMMDPISEMVPKLVDLAAKGIPAFTKLLETLVGVADSHKGLIDWAANNPIAFIITSNITKSLMQAAIGEKVRDAILLMLRGGGGVTPVPNPGGGAGPLPPGAGPAPTVAAVTEGALLYREHANNTSAVEQRKKAIIEEMKAKLAKGDKNGAIDILRQTEMDAHDPTSAFAGGFNRFARYASILNPFGGITAGLGQVAGDYITDKVTGKDNANAKLNTKALAASELIDSGELKKLLQDAVVTSVGSGIADAMKGTKQMPDQYNSALSVKN